jgi:hypothetical protein
MEIKNLIVAFVWIFAIVISVVILWVGESYVPGIGGPLVVSGFFFIIALIFSVIMLKGTKK